MSPLFLEIVVQKLIKICKVIDTFLFYFSLIILGAFMCALGGFLIAIGLKELLTGILGGLAAMAFGAGYLGVGGWIFYKMGRESRDSKSEN